MSYSKQSSFWNTKYLRYIFFLGCQHVSLGLTRHRHQLERLRRTTNRGLHWSLRRRFVSINFDYILLDSEPFITSQTHYFFECTEERSIYHRKKNFIAQNKPRFFPSLEIFSDFFYTFSQFLFWPTLSTFSIISHILSSAYKQIRAIFEISLLKTGFVTLLVSVSWKKGAISQIFYMFSRVKCNDNNLSFTKLLLVYRTHLLSQSAVSQNIWSLLRSKTISYFYNLNCISGTLLADTTTATWTPTTLPELLVS